MSTKNQLMMQQQLQLKKQQKVSIFSAQAGVITPNPAKTPPHPSPQSQFIDSRI
jgi:hypothetical protein